MNSGDGSNPNQPPRGASPSRARRKLELQGDLSYHPNADRISTVMVHADEDAPTPPPGALSLPPDRPTPAPVSQRFPSQAVRAIPSQDDLLDPDEPTPLPGALTLPDEPTPLPGVYPAMPTPTPIQTGRHASITGAQAPIRPPSRQAYSPPPPQSQAAHDAEHITSTGFNYLAITAPPAPAKKKKVPVTLKDLKNIKDLSFAWLDDADNVERLQYAGGGALAGGIVGTLFGFLNIFFQGWELSDGTGQLVALMLIFALIFALLCALRPRRVDELLSRFGGSSK